MRIACQTKSCLDFSIKLDKETDYDDSNLNVEHMMEILYNQINEHKHNNSCPTGTKRLIFDMMYFKTITGEEESEENYKYCFVLTCEECKFEDYVPI